MAQRSDDKRKYPEQTEILRGLNKGDIKRIAEAFGVTPIHISKILHGFSNDARGVIEIARELADKNVKSRQTVL
jgi:transcriptional regulator with XRE-family HTH domain